MWWSYLFFALCIISKVRGLSDDYDDQNNQLLNVHRGYNSYMYVAPKQGNFKSLGVRQAFLTARERSPPFVPNASIAEIAGISTEPSLAMSVFMSKGKVYSYLKARSDVLKLFTYEIFHFEKAALWSHMVFSSQEPPKPFKFDYNDTHGLTFKDEHFKDWAVCQWNYDIPTVYWVRSNATQMPPECQLVYLKFSCSYPHPIDAKPCYII